MPWEKAKVNLNIDIVLLPVYHMNAQLSSGARGLSLHLCPYLVCASSAGSDETAQKLRLV